MNKKKFELYQKIRNTIHTIQVINKHNTTNQKEKQKLEHINQLLSDLQYQE